MKPIEIIRAPISRELWEEHARESHGDFAKIVVDLERDVLALGGAMHSDAEEILLDDGSLQEDLWGANVFVARSIDDRLEYESLINIRPRQGNKTMILHDTVLRNRIRTIVDRLLL